MARNVDNVRLPQHLEQGARIGPTFNTSIVTLASGAEQTNPNWQDELLEIDAAYGIMDKDDPNDRENSYAAILAFFRARRGRARAFLFRDPTDCEAFEEPIVPVPGQAGFWQLSKRYDETYVRRITRPDPDTLELRKDGVLIAETQYQLIEKGGVKFVNGFDGSGVTATFLFDIPVRFVNDKLQASIAHIRAGSVPDIMLIQVRE